MTIIQIAETISNAGGRLYLVGGCVRDMILDLPAHDKDYCVTGLSKETFESLFPNAISQGKSFPVYILNGCEFALARKERKTGDKHSDFVCDSSPNITIEEDLSRRDLSINSIAVDVLTEEYIDPFGGLEDIKNKIIKHTSSAFIEDPLRVYRVARFSSQLNFKVSPTTLEIMKTMKKDLSYLSVERVFQEFRKALCTSHPTNFFNILRESNCLDIHFKEISDLIGIEQPILYHPEGDVYNHTMQVLEKTALQTNDELIRFGALVHDFGKSATPRENWPHHYGHDKLGVSIVKSFCRRLKMPHLFEKAGIISCREHMLAGIYSTLKPGTKVDFFERVYKSKALSLQGVEIIVNSDKTNNEPIEFAEVGNQVMTTIHLEQTDLEKIYKQKNFNLLSPQEKAERTKQFLREKRIRFLQELEKLTI